MEHTASSLKNIYGFCSLGSKLKLLDKNKENVAVTPKLYATLTWKSINFIFRLIPPSTFDLLVLVILQEMAIPFNLTALSAFQTANSSKDNG